MSSGVRGYGLYGPILSYKPKLSTGDGNINRDLYIDRLSVLAGIAAASEAFDISDAILTHRGLHRDRVILQSGLNFRASGVMASSEPIL